MHNALFGALGINAAYLPYAPEPENFADAIKGFRAMKFRGANVTIPYKTQFVDAETGEPRLVDELSPISRFTGSVNTLYWKDGIVGGTLCGTTTDPYGCIRNLEEHGINPTGKKIALLGNGGAAKAIAYTLVEQHNKLTIVCRSREKGELLADKLSKRFKTGIQALKLDSTVTNPEYYEPNAVTFAEFTPISAEFDIIINATSVGMSPNNNETPLTSDCLHQGQVVFDIVYAPRRTKLLQLAQEKGCTTINGVGMLIYQGIESFKTWYPKETKNKTTEELWSIMRSGILRETRIEQLQSSIQKKKDPNIVTFAHIQQNLIRILQEQRIAQQEIESLKKHEQTTSVTNNQSKYNIFFEKLKGLFSSTNVQNKIDTNQQKKQEVHNHVLKEIEQDSSVTGILRKLTELQKLQIKNQKNLKRSIVTIKIKHPNFQSKIKVIKKNIQDIDKNLDEAGKQIRTIENKKSIEAIESNITRIKRESENRTNEELIAIMRKGLQD